MRGKRSRTATYTPPCIFEIERTLNRIPGSASPPGFHARIATGQVSRYALGSHMNFSRFLSALLLICGSAFAEEAFKPTLVNVHYGPHEKQVLDLWRPEGDVVTPVLFYIHGGGWMSGNKETPDFRDGCLKSGISVVSINYRLIPDAIAEGVNPPVKACLEDAARALQFVRSKAAEWKLDKQRIGLCGGSAGGFSSLWLAFHNDLADPKSADPVAHESTRVLFAFTFVPQTSLDPVQMREWIPNCNYGNHAFTLPNFESFIEQREKLLPWINEYSPFVLATADDPPVYLFYDTPPALGQPHKDPPHSANFGVELDKKLKSLGVECEFNYPGNPELKEPNMFKFILEKLKVAPAK